MGELEARLRAEPFHAPESKELAALRLGARELAAAERAGRVLRLRDGVVLLPTAPALAMWALASLDQPFTTSQARQTLGTTRRVAIPWACSSRPNATSPKLAPQSRPIYSPCSPVYA